MKAVLTVIGRDTIGIIAKVSGYLAENKINILDISQTIMEEIFTMVMLVDLSAAEKDISVTKYLNPCIEYRTNIV